MGGAIGVGPTGPPCGAAPTTRACGKRTTAGQEGFDDLDEGVEDEKRGLGDRNPSRFAQGERGREREESAHETNDAEAKKNEAPD